MKPTTRKLTISIKDEDENETLATLTADFDLPTYFDLTTALKAAADELVD